MASRLQFPNMGFYNNLPKPKDAKPPPLTLLLNRNTVSCPPQLRCLASSEHNQETARRSANYQPSSWSYNDLVDTTTNDDSKLRIQEGARKKLEEEVRNVLDDGKLEPVAMLELIDDIHRLGLGYKFRESTSTSLATLKISARQEALNSSLHSCSLYFRLLREHGFDITPDVFEKFKDENGKFKDSIAKDVGGLLSLYEASFLGFEGENILDEAREFTTMHLNNIKDKVDPRSAEEVNHALELPLHRRVERLEARRRIQSYSKSGETNQALLTLAKIDFNTVQAVYQRDLQDLTKWWKDTALADKLSFARDRLMESFFWAIGMSYDPQHSKSREAVTKTFKLVTVLDDVYDVYGSLDELEKFTAAAERWDVDAIKDLPDYMKLCYLSLFNTVNDLAYDTLKDKGENVIPIMKKVWADLLKAFLQEAEWMNNKYTPTFDEYLNNARFSVSGCVMLVHSYFSTTHNITKEAIHSLENYHDLLILPSIVFRLANDLSSSKAEIERGETVNSITCYMNETGLSEEQAREHISKLIDESFKKMNKQLIAASTSPFEKSFTETAINLARIALCQYQYGDAHSDPDVRAKDQIASIIISPVD
ncbi:PREDICTED: isoprene synthase, chloroplastic-like isoform X1 [Ipomoea nil]|uniref:isoprene synthase, chloroplastic-like isoform X1 n=1 Tax=Ipomoea nil TaxID=35883 RepID=UPI0009013DDE|nr:PREDICTED: isoprene synthase, chloroplastic-like isoform X1 [Ipomoea nil]